MIRVGSRREPISVVLRPPYADVTVTLKRLTTADYGEARNAAMAILRDDGALLPLLVEHDLLPPGGIKGWKAMKDNDAMSYASFISGVGVWLGSVECAVRGIVSWSGVIGDDGQPAPVTRATLETLMLDDALSTRLMNHLDQAARILLVEGEPLGASPSGSSERETTVLAPTTAPGARKRTSPAPKASPSKAGAARKSSTPAKRSKA